MGMRDDTAERAHDSAEEECVDETTEETRVSSGSRQPRHTNPVVPTFHYSNDTGGAARAHALEGGAQELDSMGIHDNEDILRTQSRRVLHFARTVTPIMCALCWHAHRANSDLWDKVNVGIFASQRGFSRRSIVMYSRSGSLPITHHGFFNVSAPWEHRFLWLTCDGLVPALSCFCVNTFAANFSYLFSALFARNMKICLY